MSIGYTAVKKTILACTNDTKLSAQLASICQASSLEIFFIKNGRDLASIIDSAQLTTVLLDSNIEDPNIIDILYILSSVQCKIPIIIVGDCDEKVLLSVKRIGRLKDLYVYALHLNQSIPIKLTEILEHIDKRSQVINSEVIANALEKKQFEVYYQPKIEVRTNKLIGVEALLRWDRPNHGLIYPDYFIPIAEESGLITPMTYWVIREVFNQYVVWKKKKIELNYAINLSAKVLTDVILPDELGQMVKEFKINPEQICFEITEAAAMHWPEIVLEVLTRIRLKGFSLSIDDFGTGYSSLVELQRLPFTELKIDKSFVSDIAYNKSNLHIVRSIISLAQNMNLSLVAEGVETMEAAEQLKELGCDILQGYLYSKPLSVNDFTNWYKDKINAHGIYIHKG